MHELLRMSRRTRMLRCMLAIALLAASWAHAQTAPAGGPGKQRNRRVRDTAQTLAAQYNMETGLFRGTGWWNSANGITALADASRTLHTHQYDILFENTLQKAQQKFPQFRNEYYDDEGWWALAWLDVYDLKHDRRYLQMAQSIFSDMTGGWNDSCGGGLWWKKNERYKNAIANELFLAAAAHLASVTKGGDRAKYLDWAEREWRWFRNSGMINSDFLINDGLDSACHNNGRTTWSYNQGVILDGLVALKQVRSDESSMTYVRNIASAAMSRLADGNGVLHDACEPKCGEDGVQFKGIFARNLVSEATIEGSATIPDFLAKNADSLWENARTAQNHFSTVWSGPPSDDHTGALIAALDLLTADQRARRLSKSH
jgi:predicted alpha-1,6-mannanase (GH76 family)